MEAGARRRDLLHIVFNVEPDDLPVSIAQWSPADEGEC
jgi:hypothetical protein